MEKLVLLVLLAGGAAVSAQDCPSGSSCVPLTSCPRLSRVALELDDAAAGGSERLRLLAVIKRHMCGDLQAQKRVHVCCQSAAGGQQEYPDAEPPSFNRLTFHELSGTVTVKDSRTLVVHGFVYDGDAPDAYFVAGVSGAPGDVRAAGAAPVPYPAVDAANRAAFGDPRMAVLPAFDGSADLELTLPEGMPAGSVRWLSVYCKAYGIDFGHVVFPADLPRN